MSTQGNPRAQLPSSALEFHPLDIPPADKHRGIGLYWPEDAQPAADAGHRDAQRWLQRRNPGHLWTQLVDGRGQLRSPTQQAAYELAFLTRLEQHLLKAREIETRKRRMAQPVHSPSSI